MSKLPNHMDDPSNDPKFDTNGLTFKKLPNQHPQDLLNKSDQFYLKQAFNHHELVKNGIVLSMNGKSILMGFEFLDLRYLIIENRKVPIKAVVIDTECMKLNQQNRKLENKKTTCDGEFQVDGTATRFFIFSHYVDETKAPFSRWIKANFAKLMNFINKNFETHFNTYIKGLNGTVGFTGYLVQLNDPRLPPVYFYITGFFDSQWIERYPREQVIGAYKDFLEFAKEVVLQVLVDYYPQVIISKENTNSLINLNGINKKMKIYY
ncbi:MAG: hypothetical protein NZ480_07685 [Bdellovibrionaceae bacterium]|nr:hypothetical protein [Pseudobdellovibrionaceae bacterium]MDW8190677.1 hypothetical protein [Pseudobdellovibrionaceae bacterium]